MGPLVPAIAVTLGVFVMAYGLYRWMAQRGQRSRRVSDVVTPPSIGRKRKGISPLAQRLNNAINRSRLSRAIAMDLARANIAMKPSEFLLVAMGAGAVGVLLGTSISHNLIGGVMSGILGAFLPRWYLVRREQKRLKEFHNQIPDILSLMTSALRAGYGLNHAMKMVVNEMPPPASEEFGRVIREINLGVGVTEAFQHLVERTENKDMELIVTAISIQHEVGGNLGDILESISETIRERVRIRGEIQVMTAQQRMSGYVLTALPFLLGLALMLINPDYMMGMFQPGWPILMPISAVVMMGIGYLVMRAIIKSSEVY